MPTSDVPASKSGRVDVVVVGAGLSGLSAARLLDREGLSVRVLEARQDVGGRLLTVAVGDGAATATVDMGGTWHWADQPEVAALAAELGIVEYPQHDQGSGLHELVAGEAPLPVAFPPLPAAAFLFEGGTQQICERMAEQLRAGSVRTGVAVSGLALDEAGVVATTVDGATLGAGHAVVAMPPRLAAQRIAFTPELPERLDHVMRETPTWMGGAFKVVVTYPHPFWRDRGLSGAVLSEVGPLTEVHDACGPHAGVGVLWAFGQGKVLRTLSPPERRQAVIEHLVRLFGPDASQPSGYAERDWATESRTRDQLPPPSDPIPFGHARLGQPVWGGRLYLAGAETSGPGGGHMEGAVQSGLRAARLILAHQR